MKKWFCFLGLHDWHPFAWNSVVEPLPVEQCSRCRIGRKFYLCGAEVRYTADAMAEATRELEDRN